MNNRELTHVWAQQTQDNGKGSNMFFERTKIYSYGYHFCIANFIRPGIVLFTSREYSNTTAKHKSYTSRAIHSAKVFVVPNVEIDETYKIDAKKYHSENVEYFYLKIKNLLSDSIRSNKNSEWLTRQAESIKQDAIDYCNEFKLGKRLLNKINSLETNTPELNERIEKQREKQAIRGQLEQLQAEQLEQFIKNEALQAWVNFEQLPKMKIEVKGEIFYKSVSIHSVKNSFLRLNGETVETSHGASVPLTEAKILFELIKANRDIKGHKIGNYTVISINGVLTIGCHKIERSEINRFAASQNWGQIENH